MALRFAASLLVVLGGLCQVRAIELTTPTRGPYTISGNQILDSRGRPFLIRGTRLAPLSADPADLDGTTSTFGPHSLTTLVTIRQRLNMNAVRLPLDPALFLSDPAYRLRVNRIAAGANRFELLVILEAVKPASPEALASVWLLCATQFRGNPNIYFAVQTREDALTIRSAGALQPIILPNSSFFPPLGQTIDEIEIGYGQTWSYPSGVPILADGLDPNLSSTGPDCEAFPGDPADATQLLEKHLDDFDRRGISWTISEFVPGKMITDYRYFIGTKLDDGWTCGQRSDIPAGIGLNLLAHLWNTRPDALFTVNSNRGGFVIARGGVATAYGPILAETEIYAHPPWPTLLGNVSVRITDSVGNAFLAPLLYTGAGWSNISFQIPEDCATGPAEAAIVRTDGSISRSRIVIEDVVPGIWTTPYDGRGPAFVSLLDGRRIRISASGVRFALPNAGIQVVAGSRELKVISLGPDSNGEPGKDQVTVELPSDLNENNETDLFLVVDSVLSNVARINVGQVK
jgi:hypothetical protein